MVKCEPCNRQQTIGSYILYNKYAKIQSNYIIRNFSLQNTPVLVDISFTQISINVLIVLEFSSKFRSDHWFAISTSHQCEANKSLFSPRRGGFQQVGSRSYNEELLRNIQRILVFHQAWLNTLYALLALHRPLYLRVVNRSFRRKLKKKTWRAAPPKPSNSSQIAW